MLWNVFTTLVILPSMASMPATTAKYKFPWQTKCCAAYYGLYV